MSSSTPLRNIAIFGAGGNNIGHHLLHALLANTSFTVSVIARASSRTIFPPTATIIRIPDTPSHTDLLTAFHNQDAIVSCIGYPAKLSEPALIDAAISAGVKRFIPSEYGLNNDLPSARQLNPIFASKGSVIDYLRSKKSTSSLTWTSIPTGMWLDWSLSPSIAFLGINPTTHTAIYHDNGTHRLSFNTLPWAAQAIVKILENPDSTANRIFPVRAFEASQQEVVAELEKQQGVKYKVEKLDGKRQIAEQKQKLSEGDEAAVYALIAAGFLLPGYGSNLVDEAAVPVGSDQFIGLTTISVQSVVKDVVEKLEKGERTY